MAPIPPLSSLIRGLALSTISTRLSRTITLPASPLEPRQDAVSIVLTVTRATTTYLTTLDLSSPTSSLSPISAASITASTTSSSPSSTITVIPPAETTGLVTPVPTQPIDNGKLVAAILVPILSFLVILVVVWKCCFDPRSALYWRPGYYSSDYDSDYDSGSRSGSGRSYRRRSHSRGGHSYAHSSNGSRSTRKHHGHVFNRGGGGGSEYSDTTYGYGYAASGSVKRPEKVKIRRERVSGSAYGGAGSERYFNVKEKERWDGRVREEKGVRGSMAGMENKDGVFGWGFRGPGVRWEERDTKRWEGVLIDD